MREDSPFKSSNRKAGGNKGILAARKLKRREEAEARNALTLPENRRAARSGLSALVQTNTTASPSPLTPEEVKAFGATQSAEWHKHQRSIDPFQKR